MPTTTLDARQLLVPQLVVMVIANIVVQVVVALDGHRIGVPAQAATVVVALLYVWFLVTRGRQLIQVRFGRLVAHLVAFLTVNFGFHAHAAWLLVTNSPAIRGTADFPIDAGWFGVLFGMFVFWGLGLLIHLASSTAMRGYEELRA